MSDGPHRSLPLKKHWRDAAERAAKPAYSASDVTDAFTRAVAMELADTPVEPLRRILGSASEGTLFAGDADALLDQLDMARALCRGSAAGNALIDGAVQAIREGAEGDTALEHAAEYCALKVAQSHNRSIEEHYQRKAGDRSARHVRNRLDEATTLSDVAAIARSRVNTPPRTPRPPKLERRTGLDQGPPL